MEVPHDRPTPTPATSSDREVIRGLRIRLPKEWDPAEIREALEMTRQTVWLSRSCRCPRGGLLGVPLRRIDVLVEDRTNLDPRDAWTAEVVQKRGRYSGEYRPRVVVRVLRGVEAVQLPLGLLMLEEQDGGAYGRWAVRLQTAEAPPSAEWEATFDRLRIDLDGYDLARVVMWQWSRYYATVVRFEDARSLADAFTADPTWMLSRANQEASRLLYRAARDAGYRKLTQRERLRLGLHSGQWVPEVVYAAAQERLGGWSATGVGEATLRAAVAGGSLEPRGRPTDDAD